MAVHRRVEAVEVGLVQDLVGLQVDGPVSRAALQGEVGLSRDLLAAAPPRRIPGRAKGADLRIADLLHRLPGPVVAVSDADHQLVDQGQEGADRLAERIPQAFGLAQDGEAGHPHDEQLEHSGGFSAIARSTRDGRGYEGISVIADRRGHFVVRASGLHTGLRWGRSAVLGTAVQAGGPHHNQLPSLGVKGAHRDSLVSSQTRSRTGTAGRPVAAVMPAAYSATWRR